jgi:SAM-dependent methyltransferase
VSRTKAFKAGQPIRLVSDPAQPSATARLLVCYHHVRYHHIRHHQIDYETLRDRSVSDTGTSSNAAQIAYWNSEAGPRWVAMQERMDAMLAALLLAALERARPGAGERVLDIGCGCGATLLELAGRVGSGGSVMGVDVSAPMLGRARERVQANALTQVRLTLSDAATHEFERGAFDLAFSRFGVMFFDDPVAAFANIRTAIAANGRLVFACWAPPRDNPWLTVPLAAARPHLPPQPEADPNAPGPFAFADPDRVRGILMGAGYSAVDIARHDTSMRICGPGEVDAAARFAVESGPVGRAMATATPDARTAAEQAIASELRRIEGPDGIALPGSVWLVSARP